MYFDIGANVGKWALSNVHMTNKIICVEASPRTFRRLIKSCVHPNIEMLNYAVCNSEHDTITFYESDCDTISTLNKDWLADTNSRFYNTCSYSEVVCTTIRLDTLITLYGVPDLIKIDVEGAEYDCIRSLTQKVPLLCFEWASELNDMTLQCIQYLSSLGFTEFYLQFEDTYTFRPSEYYDMETLITKLGKTTPKREWGMIWCR
jgi:FkbM family methyltransferase